MRFSHTVTTRIPTQIRAVLAAYAVAPARVQLLTTGLINKTYRITDEQGQDYILQAVNTLFAPEVNLDIDVVTRHLERSGLLTPRLQRSWQDAVFHRHDGQVWRLFNYISGNVHERLQQPAPAGAAGAMLGRVHAALARLDYELRAPKPGAHDTPRHVRHLQDTLAQRHDHARYTALQPLGEAILARLAQRPPLPAVAGRMVHGDPKISNFIFTGDDREVQCMVDFDTVNRMPVYLELGDALRSWCNPSGEDSVAGTFSMAHCRAALAEYAHQTGALLTLEEWCAVPAATLTIYLELAARFCADALNEDYFSWDPKRFGSHSEHSETRARGQFNAANSLLEQYRELTDLVKKTAVVFDMYPESV